MDRDCPEFVQGLRVLHKTVTKCTTQGGERKKSTIVMAYYFIIALSALLMISGIYRFVRGRGRNLFSAFLILLGVVLLLVSFA